MVPGAGGVCAAVPGGWGLKGWASVYFTQADEDLIHTSMETAWCNVAPKSIANGKASPQP